jgi:outer membrane protein TolC
MLKFRKSLLLPLVVLSVVQLRVVAQTEPRVASQSGGTSLPRYFDPANGTTADQAVIYALSHNVELLAARSEVEASRALVRQAALRPNPSVEFERKEQLGGSDNTSMVAGEWPLELGGRKSARVL